MLDADATTPSTAMSAEVASTILSKTDSLKTVPVPGPNDQQLGKFVRDKQALVVLGKALFWDQQVGSDGQACASCHFHAGADNRSKNALDTGGRNTAFPGGDMTFAVTQTGGGGPNYQLLLADFPLSRVGPDGKPAPDDVNDIAGSQGVFNTNFTDIIMPVPTDGNGANTDDGNADPTGLGGVFSWHGAEVRNVEPRNTPTAINAVFNHRNFWDGRGRNEFHGVNPIGRLDPGARVLRMVHAHRTQMPKLVQIQLTDSSLASQATGPIGSEREMAFFGRASAKLGKKLLVVMPLALQLVATDDSVLGAWSNQTMTAGAYGMKTTYGALIAQAFLPEWWDGTGYKVTYDATGAAVIAEGAPTGTNEYSLMEANVALFFGLAVQAYEQTLVANDTRFDRYLEALHAVTGGPTQPGFNTDLHVLSVKEQHGLQIFVEKARCVRCHSGPELTGASVRNVNNDGPMERMIMGDDHVAVYDTGYYNIGVRPTSDDLGVGATIGPDNLPLSFSRFYQQDDELWRAPRIRARPDEASVLLHKAANLIGNPGNVADLLDEGDAVVLTNPTAASTSFVAARDAIAAASSDPTVPSLLKEATSLLPDPVDPGPDPMHPYGPPLTKHERVAVDGAFKVPSLRNIEITAPYFHNGGMATLEQVVDFYNRGGDFHELNEQNLDPDLEPIGLTVSEKQALVAFLKTLTDDRVRYEKAPFDHPSMNLPNGGGNAPSFNRLGAPALDDRMNLPATGASGSSTPQPNFLGL